MDQEAGAKGRGDGGGADATTKYLVLVGGLLVLLLVIGYGITSIELGPLKIGLTPPEGDATATAAPGPTSDQLTPTSEAGAPPPATPTPAGVSNPAGPVPAGTPILANGYRLTVAGDVRLLDAETAKPTISIGRITLENVSDVQRRLQFRRAAITLRDDLGNVYDPTARRQALYEDLEIVLDPGAAVVLNSYATLVDATDLTTYAGPVAPQATTLIVRVDGLGPFSGIVVEVDW
jgi:hypothetical protein